MTNMMRKFRSGLVLGTVLLGLETPLQIHAAVTPLAVYNFNAGTGSGVSTDADANSTAGVFAGTGLTTSFIVPVASGGGGFTGGDASFAIRATTASMANANTAPGSAGDFFGFTIQAASGYVLNLSGSGALTFKYARDSWGSGAVFNWQVRSSVDSFASTLGAGNVATRDSWSTASITLPASFDNLSSASPVEFRIYVWDNGQNDTTTFGYLDNVTLNGVSAVPEPANVALAVFGLGAVGVGAGRRLYARRMS